ncbi:NADH-quinone oxidoreductase subunit L [Nostocoides vanveenii]|uniref:NADH-quinone oxidoreductase subunit L n=1 Tax=Nostocoides vanveenii TaxID=330835 RepID=A0ABP4WXS1_9MICO
MTSLISQLALEATASDAVSLPAWLLIALPLAGAALLLFGGRATNSFGPALATGLSWASFGLGVAALMQLVEADPEDRLTRQTLYNWIPAGSFQLNTGLQVDTLSISFVMLITFVGSLIHVYSMGYMAHDPNKRRFFGYLNLFVASMLLLVLADSYLLLFVGWEGVGLASYLLIGFWFHNPAYATAGNKAFFVNRVGDIGLALAIFLMFATFGGVDFATVNAGVGKANTATLTAIGLLLLMGACGKSAQFPLQSWLGDAMAGPTPVSALIHAATMVTAGVYLVVRSHAIFEGAPNAQLAVVIVGAITLLYGAIVGCAKDDIKKALAASTMSQIGYMMLAAGLGPVGYAFAIFHLITHGFFKAGMFLGAGSVMHGMDNQVDMRRFGHLAPYMKITWITFGLGWLAILGVPPFSGFWSKDKIIEAAFIGEGWRPWVFGGAALLGAGVTAFYMSRLFFMTFQGKARWTDGQHPHESPLSMTIPMMILAVGSAAIGLVLGPTNIFTDWLEPLTGHHDHGEPVIAVPVLMALTLLLVLAGLALAWLRYGRDDVPEVAPAGNALTRAARKDLYQDDLNEAIFMWPGIKLVRSVIWTDNELVDGGVTGLARFTGGAAKALRVAQNGFARSYALTMLTGVVAILGALWVMN